MMSIVKYRKDKLNKNYEKSIKKLVFFKNGG